MVKSLILGGLGLNCEDETKFAFERAGSLAKIVHVNDLITNPQQLRDYQIFCFPGGFSYGDDTGAGNALADKVRLRLLEHLVEFVDSDKLILGICNGFQVLANLGLVPALDGKYGERQAALVHNTSARYDCRWVDLYFPCDVSPWTWNVEETSLPIAHGEGRFFVEPDVLWKIKVSNGVAARYVNGEMCKWQGLEANPNGSLDDIAGIIDGSGRVLGMMPHPERAIHVTQLPNYTYLREVARRNNIEISEEGPGLQIFKNGVKYFE